jgi:hypothetical protein
MVGLEVGDEFLQFGDFSLQLVHNIFVLIQGGSPASAGHPEKPGGDFANCAGKCNNRLKNKIAGPPDAGFISGRPNCRRRKCGNP